MEEVQDDLITCCDTLRPIPSEHEFVLQPTGLQRIPWRPNVMYGELLFSLPPRNPPHPSRLVVSSTTMLQSHHSVESLPDMCHITENSSNASEQTSLQQSLDPLKDSTEFPSDDPGHHSEYGRTPIAAPIDSSEVATLAELFEHATGDSFTCNIRRAARIKSHEIHTLNEAIKFLDQSWPTRTTDSTVRVNMLVIPTTKHTYFSVRKFVRGIMNLDEGTFAEDPFAYSSSTGRLLVSKDKRSTLFETPWTEGPYSYLLLVKRTANDERPWRGIYIYEAKEWTLDEFWDTAYQPERDVTRQNGPQQASFDVFARLMSWVVSGYLAWAQAKIESIGDRIKEVEESVEKETTDSTNELTRKLNSCAREMRTLHLDQAIVFSLHAAQRASELLKSSGYYHEAHDVLHQLFRGRDTHPGQLKERIAEVRIQLAELREEWQRDKQDQLQHWSIAIAQQSIDIAKQSRHIATETHRDSRTMRGIAWVTVAFLPATFVTSFFGMNFFNGKPGTPAFDDASQNVWIFFAVAVPISAVVLAAFWWWDRKQETTIVEEWQEGDKRGPQGTIGAMRT